MGENSVFDDIGLGMSDLGLAPDPKKQREEAANKIQAEKDKMAEDERVADAEFAASEDEARVARGSRSQTVLSGGLDGEEDEDGTSVSRRTLLGS